MCWGHVYHLGSQDASDSWLSLNDTPDRKKTAVNWRKKLDVLKRQIMSMQFFPFFCFPLMCEYCNELQKESVSPLFAIFS